jgi:hypothetical protein
MRPAYRSSKHFTPIAEQRRGAGCRATEIEDARARTAICVPVNTIAPSASSRVASAHVLVATPGVIARAEIFGAR